MKNENGKIYFGIGLDNDQLRADALQSRNIIKGIGDSTVAESSRIDNAYKKAAGAAVAYFSATAIKQFGIELIEITGKFQTFQAVLTNTLQSPAKARASMLMLQEFAATTPFQVDALTGAFVKLANQGFVPTYNQMIKLGDLASSTGKGFDQLAEAIIDAQTGEFERLKEFGIRANKEGDKVTFTFKEQATQVDFTASSIRDYVLSLGELKGVQGANAEIAKTLTGQVSNLQDTITQKMNEIGQFSEGVLSGALSGVSMLVEHYEEIGRVLGVLITSYGFYRGAIIAYAAIQKVAVAAGNVKAFFDLAKGIKTAKDAQIAFNLAMGANPLTKIASILFTVGGLIWAFARNTSDATDEVVGLNKALKDAGAEFEKEAAKVEALQSVMNNGNVAYDERKKALNELKAIIPDYNAQLTTEGVLINNNTEAIKEYLVQLERQILLKAIQEEKEDAIRKKRQTEKLIKNQEKVYQRAKDNVSGVVYGGDAGIEGKVFNIGDLKKEASELERLQIKLEKTNKTLAELEGEFISTSNSVNKGDKTVKSFAEQLQFAALRVTTLKNELTQLKAGQGNEANFAKSINEKKEELAQAEQIYNTLLSVDKKYLKEKEKEFEKAEQAVKDMQLKATNDFYDAEIALKRKQITDKVKLIEFDRDNTIAAIEAEKQAYLQLAVASGAKTSDIDTSMYENRKQMITLSAKIDIDNVGVEEMDKVKTQLEALKQEFETFEQERTRIQAEYAAKRKAMYEEDDKTLKQEFTQGNVEELDRQTNKALADMDASIRGSTGLWSSLFENFAYKSKKDLTEIADNARNVLEYVNNTPVNKIEGKFGMSSEQLKALKNDVSGFADAYEKLNEIESAANSKNPFSALIGGAKSYKNSLERVETAKKALESVKANSNSTASDIKEAEQAVEDAEQASEKIKINLKESVAEVGQKMTQIGDAFKQAGESLENNILSDIGQSLSLIGNTASKITSGDYLGAVLGLFTAWAEAEGRHKKALKEVQQSIIEYQKEYNALLHDAAMESSDSIFGDKKLIDAKKYYAEAQKQQDILNLKMNDLASGKVVTGHKKTGLFGWGKGKDLYSDILSVYPELIDENGKFNAGVAETILSTQKLDDTTTQTLNNLVQYSNQAEAAMNALNDISNEIVGGMASTMTDAIFNAIEEGASGWDAFHDSGADAIKALGKMMVKELIITNYLDKYSDDIAEMLGKGDKEGIMDIFKQIATEMPSIYELAADATQQIYDAADKAGYDMIGEADREASKRGIATASQDSVDENNGRLTSIQGHIYSINESIKIIQPDIASIKDIMSIMKGNSAEQLKVLQGIESNTAPISEIKTELKYVKSALETIRDKGITIKK